MKDGLLCKVKAINDFFERSTSCLSEEDGDFVPKDGMLSVKEQVAHAAQSIDWFLDGIKSPEGFDMNFENHWIDVKKCNTLTEARNWFSKSIERAIELINNTSEEELSSPLPEGPIMGGQPKYVVFGSMSEHTAHHRGALTVYSRLLGKEPQMPYMP